MPADLRLALLACAAAIAACAANVAGADPAPFDLVGPRLEVSVTRGANTLPITRVPNLAPNDRLVLKAEMPASQSAHYLMVAAFLRGPTNPPPATWFFRCDTWTPACQRDGLQVAVPKDAQQLVVFFAPETGGDFKTLVNAVRGRPGAFVRASQQLAQAGLDHTRLDHYLGALRALDQADTARVKEVAPVLARSLAIKVDEKCLDRIPAMQAPCLMQGQDALILSDGHSASMVAMLTSGPASDLAMQAGNTALLGSGAYSPFIGSILDIGRLMDSVHTAQYQYIPALTAPQGDGLVLRLNTPPSFHDPKSVLVAALPEIAPTAPPPLRTTAPAEPVCVRKAPLVIPVEGAPLVFSTDYAHDMVLTGTQVNGHPFALPLRPDPSRGGFVADATDLDAVAVDAQQPARLRGTWGFDSFEGPAVRLADSQAKPWTMAAAEQTQVIVGRDNVVHLDSASVYCVSRVRLRDAAAVETDVPWKAVAASQLEVRLPLKDRQAGAWTLVIDQHGLRQPQSVDLIAFAEPGQFDSFAIHAGDTQGVLKGRRLEQLAGLTVGNVEFAPADPVSPAGATELRLAAPPGASLAGWQAGQAEKATVRLRDGRTFPLDFVVATPRPRGSLLAKKLRPDASSGGLRIEIGSADELPLGATLSFSVRTEWPATFQRDEAIEVATIDGAYSTRMSLANGQLTLSDAKEAVATLDTARAFGPSAFGPLQYRLVTGEVAGDWHPLARLVRLPTLTHLDCEAAAESCQLTGGRLFLLDSVCLDAQCATPVTVPGGFPDFALTVPRPSTGRLYLRVRDDPGPVSSVQVPAPPPAAAAPAPTADRRR